MAQETRSHLVEDGYDLVRMLRNRNSLSAGIPAIAVTAYARLEDREHALIAGFQAHLPKPVAPRDLVATVERLARRRGESA